MTGTRQPTLSELRRLVTACTKRARRSVRMGDGASFDRLVAAAAGGYQDCYDATVDQLGYDVLMDCGRESRR